MRKEDFYEAIAHRCHGIEADPAQDKAKERTKIAADTADFLAAGGKVEVLGRQDHGFKFGGFMYRMDFAGSLPKKEEEKNK